MVAKAGVVQPAVAVVPPSDQMSRRRRSFNKPSWLLCTIADLDERMNTLIKKMAKGNSPDSFSERANSYYGERPELLALINDLYNGYLCLADRYCQALAKSSSFLPILKSDETDEGEGETGDAIDSDAESSLSFQPPIISHIQAKEMDADMIIADLVMKNVDCDIVSNDLSVVEKRCDESSTKLELQKNLLDVLESERLILLNDNAMLGYRVTALVEENEGLVAETMFLKRKAAGMARCAVKTRENHRVCMLSQKIEDLQGQIHGLEKRNKEYYVQLVKQEDTCPFSVGGGAPGLSKCFSFNVRAAGDRNPKVKAKRGSKLWDRVKKFELFQRCHQVESPKIV